MAPIKPQRTFVALLACTLAWSLSPGQANEDLAESFITNDEVSGGDIDEARLEDFFTHQRKINVNDPEVAILVERGLLQLHLHQALQSYRLQHGDLLSVYELQAVPGFEVDLIRALMPFIVAEEILTTGHLTDKLLRSKASHHIDLLWSRQLEKARGYKAPDEETPVYAGDPSRLYLRYRYISKHLSFGISGEKDPGEALFKGNNTSGFDNYNYHISINNLAKWLPTIVIGKYTFGLGQGLIGSSSFSIGKSFLLGSLKRHPIGVRPFRGVGEGIYLNGIGFQVRPYKNLEVTLAASVRKRDANIVFEESDSTGHGISHFTSIQNSGYHRSVGEETDESQLKHSVFGLSARYRVRDISAAVNVIRHSFNIPWIRPSTSYNHGRFQGQNLWNASIDLSYRLSNWYFFGETGISDNGAVAGILGVLATLDRKTDIALYFRALPWRFQTIEASPLAEASDGRNEFGVYFGLTSRPARSLEINAFIDIWKNPWLKFNAAIPSVGNEIFLRITWLKKRQMKLYAQLRTKERLETIRAENKSTESARSTRRTGFRLHFENNISKELEMRSRLEYQVADPNSAFKSTGILLYQDFLYNPRSIPLSFSSRIALFDTQSWDARIYAFESDYTGMFGIPAYSYKGMRTYLNIRYKFIHNGNIEFRIARWLYTNRESIGSGHDTIDGSTKTDLRLRVRCKF